MTALNPALAVITPSGKPNKPGSTSPNAPIRLAAAVNTSKVRTAPPIF